MVQTESKTSSTPETPTQIADRMDKEVKESGISGGRLILANIHTQALYGCLLNDDPLHNVFVAIAKTINTLTSGEIKCEKGTLRLGEYSDPQDSLSLPSLRETKFIKSEAEIPASST